MCIVGCIGHRPNETTSMFLSTLWEQRALFCTHQPLSPLCWFLIFIFLIQHLALFNFSDKICWESLLLLNDLSLICLSLYVLCILDCAGSILDGINGLHSKWCSLSRLFCLYYWDGLLSVFFPWWFEIVRFVQLLLNKILQMKKRNYMCAKFELWVIWEETTSFHWHDLLNPHQLLQVSPGKCQHDWGHWNVPVTPLLSLRGQSMLSTWWIALTFYFFFLLKKIPVKNAFIVLNGT